MSIEDMGLPVGLNLEPLKPKSGQVRLPPEVPTAPPDVRDDSVIVTKQSRDQANTAAGDFISSFLAKLITSQT